MAGRKWPQLTLAEAARLFNLLADESRLRILLLLGRDGELSVTKLSEFTGQSQPAISHHLTLLRLGRLVECRRAGKFSYYSVTSALARDLLGMVSG